MRSLFRAPKPVIPQILTKTVAPFPPPRDPISRLLQGPGRRFNPASQTRERRLINAVGHSVALRLFDAARGPQSCSTTEPIPASTSTTPKLRRPFADAFGRETARRKGEYPCPSDSCKEGGTFYWRPLRRDCRRYSGMTVCSNASRRGWHHFQTLLSLGSPDMIELN